MNSAPSYFSYSFKAICKIRMKPLAKIRMKRVYGYRFSSMGPVVISKHKFCLEGTQLSTMHR